MGLQPLGPLIQLRAVISYAPDQVPGLLSRYAILARHSSSLRLLRSGSPRFVLLPAMAGHPVTHVNVARARGMWLASCRTRAPAPSRVRNHSPASIAAWLYCT
jgi:hypothetical protein